MMPDLAEALNSSIAELMEEDTATKNKRGPQSKLQLQIEQISNLPRAKQKFVMDMLDTVIQQAAH